MWQKLKLLAGDYQAGNTSTHNELVAVLDELKRQGGITELEYAQINTSLGDGVLFTTKKVDTAKTGNFTKDSLRYELNKVFADRLSEIMNEVKNTELAELIKKYVAGGNDKVRSEIDEKLRSVKMKNKSTIAEIEMILNRVEQINKAVGSFFGRLGSGNDQDVDVALHDMLRRGEIDKELKDDILKAINDLYVGNGLFFQRYF